MDWEPATDKHAIERAALTFQFSEWLPSVVWKRVITKANSAFPRETHTASVLGTQTIQMGSPIFVSPLAGLPNVENAYGYVYRAITSEKPTEDITLKRDSFTIGTAAYGRWAGFLETAKCNLTDYLLDALGVVSITSVQMEYWDRFNQSSKRAPRYRALLESRSIHLPRSVFRHRGMWHAHTGFFAAPPSEKLLVNLNIDVIDIPRDAVSTETKKSVGIYSMVKDTRPEYQNTEDIFEIADVLHRVVNREFASLLTPAMQIALSINVPGE